jgi:hypothetical protein
MDIESERNSFIIDYIKCSNCNTYNICVIIDNYLYNICSICIKKLVEQKK